MDQEEIAALRQLNHTIKEYYEDRDIFKEIVLGLFHNLVVHERYGGGVYDQTETQGDGGKLRAYSET